MKYAQPTIKQAQKWADALRSGKYNQDTGRLNTDEGFCCLGVACKVFHPKYKTNRGVLLGTIPLTVNGASKWLEKIDDDSHLKLGVEFSSLNDLYRYSFNEIADIIELLYVHKAL